MEKKIVNKLGTRAQVYVSSTHKAEKVKLLETPCLYEGETEKKQGSEEERREVRGCQ